MYFPSIVQLDLNHPVLYPSYLRGAKICKTFTISSPYTMAITYAAVFPRFSAHGTFRAKRLKRRVEERVRRDGCIRRQ